MQTLQQVRAMFPPTTIWLPAVHVIDLQASGPIDAHIDTLDVRIPLLAHSNVAALTTCNSFVVELWRDYAF